VIITRAEVKTLLGITDTSKDALIDALLPLVQDDLINYCNQHFDKAALDSDGLEYPGGITVSFTASTKTVTDTAGGLPFSAGQNVYIEGSRFNDGHYTIVTAADGSFTVSESLTDETAGASITIRLVVFPLALKMIMADMLNFKLQLRDIGVTGENISGAISTSFSDDGGTYPPGIFNALNKYKVVGFY
jgi:hypothetical protein